MEKVKYTYKHKSLKDSEVAISGMGKGGTEKCFLYTALQYYLTSFFKLRTCYLDKI